MIKTPTKFIALLSVAAFLMSSAFAQGVTTAPVGYVTTSAANGVDAKFGISMERAALLAANVDSVVAGVLTLSADPSAATDGDYVQFTSGALLGQWFQVSSSDATSITVVEDLASLGALASDQVKVVPFWTLSTLFGTGFPNSANIFAADAQILLNDVTTTGINLAPNRNYAYHDGTGGTLGAGWFDVNAPFPPTIQDDVIIAPNSFITIRNESGAAYELVVAGAVPVDVLNLGVVADGSLENDNLVYNPYPHAIALSTSGLESVVANSPNIFAAGDQVIVYGTPAGLNPAPSSNYAYHDGTGGTLAEGWFDVNAPFPPTIQDSVTIPAGGAFLIRKAAGSVSGNWTALIPYTL